MLPPARLLAPLPQLGTGVVQPSSARARAPVVELDHILEEHERNQLVAAQAHDRERQQQLQRARRVKEVVPMTLLPPAHHLHLLVVLLARRSITAVSHWAPASSLCRAHRPLPPLWILLAVMQNLHVHHSVLEAQCS